MSDLSISFDGYEHRGWTDVDVNTAMGNFAGSFELKITDSRGTGKGGLTARDIETDMPCVIHIDDDLVLTGYIDEALPVYDANDHSITVKGRSKAGDLVDCSMVERPFLNRTLLQIATENCTPFGITATDSVGLDKPFKKIIREHGQTLFEFLEYAARIRAALFISQPDGNLLITRASSERIETPLILGENIRAGKGLDSRRDRFTEYLVHSQTGGDDQSFGGVISFINGESKDPHWRKGRYRPTVFEAEGLADIEDCKLRAKWQRNIAFGRSQRRTYTVAGWRHADGLWLPNRLVTIDDPWMKPIADPLTVAARFRLNEDGERTELTIMPKAAFELIELPEPVYDEGGGF